MIEEAELRPMRQVTSESLMRICVFCSSSDAIDPIYFAYATALGEAMAERGHSLIFGGGTVGLMGAVARAVRQGGGYVFGVVPERLRIPGVVYDHADELIVTETMRQRKQIMEDNADAFITLPGGIGTLEEVLEIITLKQLGYHTKAVVLFNGAGFFDPLLAQLDQIVAQQFAKPEMRLLYHVSPAVDDALTHIERYEPPAIPRKWAEARPPIAEEMEAMD